MTTLLSATATSRAIDTIVDYRDQAADYRANAVKLDSIGMQTAAAKWRRRADRLESIANQIATDLALLVTR